MGESFTFKCSGCGYSATVSGGDDQGMIAKTTTIMCRACARLYDAVTGKLEDGFAEIPIRCPRSKKHTVERWTDPGPCPKCGKPMEQDPDLHILWD